MKGISSVLIPFLFLPVAVRNAHAYEQVDAFVFPLDSYTVGCNTYWGTCVQSWHLGEDSAASAGTNVYAIANGMVKEAQSHSGYGGIYIIEHTLRTGEKIVSVYGHLNVESFVKSPGQEVAKGEYLGKVGTTSQNGGWPEHLHLGIHKGAYDGGAATTCNGEWSYAGYTSCSSVNGNWYAPSDIIGTYLSNVTPQRGQSINAAKSGTLAWTPANVECQYATRWYRVMGNGELELIADSFRQIVYPPSVCAQFSVTATCKP